MYMCSPFPLITILEPQKMVHNIFFQLLSCRLSKDPPAPARSSWQIENTREPIPGERTAFALFAFSWVFLHCFSFLSARKKQVWKNIKFWEIFSQIMAVFQIAISQLEVKPKVRGGCTKAIVIILPV